MGKGREREFGRKAAAIVAGASEPDKSLSWEERKRGTINKLKTVSLESALVSAADPASALPRAMAPVGEEDHTVALGRGERIHLWLQWAAENGVHIDPGYSTEHRAGGTRALGDGVPALSREQLSVLPLEEWQKDKARFVYEEWMSEAKRRLGRRAVEIR